MNVTIRQELVKKATSPHRIIKDESHLVFYYDVMDEELWVQDSYNTLEGLLDADDNT